MRGIGFGLGLLAALALALAAPVHSQTIVPASGVEFDDADLFKPTVDPGPFLSIYDSATLAAGRFSIGSYLDYALDPMSARRRVGGSEENVDVVDNLVALSLLGSIGVTPRFQIGMDLPLYLIDESDVILGTQIRDDTTVNVGDFLVNAKFHLLGSRRGFGLALMPTLGLPTGNRREFAGTGKFSYGGRVAADYTAGRWAVGVNFGGMIRDGFGGRDEDDDLEDQFRWGLGLSRAIGSRASLIGEVYGVTDGSQEFHSPAEILGAVRWNVGPVDLTIGAGGGLNDGKNAPLFRVLFGVTAPLAEAFAPAAPGEEPFAGPAELRNSRKTYVVEDHDRNGQVSPGDVIVYTITLVNTGAQSVQNVVVSDPIPDNTDYVAGSTSVDRLPLSDSSAYATSPPSVVVPIASIGAGAGANQKTVSFKARIKPDLATAATIRNEARVDGDGIDEFALPAVDTAVFPAAAQREKVVQTTPPEGRRKLEVTENIQFEEAGSTLLPQSHAVLDQVASILREQPELRIRIIGHTDDVGDANANMKLSMDRAESVKRYLVDKGVSGSRLEATGRGEFEPIAPNETEDGRAANRRVEFIVISGSR
ncbi:MAG: OmpA family protein [Candidatus Binatia bacterium]